MKRNIYLLLLLAFLGKAVAAQSEDFSKLRRMFDYDRNIPLDVKEAGVENRDAIQVHDISYASPKGGRVSAYLVVPPGKGKFAGIIFMHMRPGSRKNFLDEALSLAKVGAVSLLIDAPFSRAGESKRDFDPTVTHPEIDRDIYIQTVIDLRRGVDLLVSRSDVDSKRIGFIGHSYGAHTGAVLAGVEKRIRAYVIMAGAPSLTEFLRTSTLPAIVKTRDALTKAQQENYFTTLATVDPINYVPQVAPSALLFQFGKRDTYPTEQNAARYFQAASNPKSIKWYDAGHALNDEARNDRALWLQKQMAQNVCDLHLSRIKTIPFTGQPSHDAHYDALENAGKSAVPCLIANVTNTRYAPDPRPIPRWGTMRMTVGDRAVYMLWHITGVDPIKMLPRRYQLLHQQIGVYALDEYLHGRRANRRTLQRKLWRWYRTTYLPSVRKAQHNSED